jgi:hypothetical protein
MNPVVTTVRNFERSFTFSNVILFVLCIVIIITYIYQTNANNLYKITNYVYM